MSKTIVIIGSTGAQGGGVARAVVANKAFKKVKLATRHPNADKMKSLLQDLPGTKAVRVDLNDKFSLVVAFKGADAVFGTFNYWGTLAAVGYDEAKAVEMEIQQGKNVVDAAKEASVKHVVLSTLEDVATLTGGKVKCWHFTTKGRIETYARQQEIPCTFVRYAFYYQNFEALFQGDAQGNVHLAMKDHVLQTVDTEDAGKAVAKIFQEGPRVWAGREIGLAGDSMPVQAYLDIYNEVKQAGVQRKYVPEDWEEKAKNPVTKELAEMFYFYTDYDKQCIRDVSATKQLYPGMRSYYEYAHMQWYQQLLRLRPNGQDE